MSWQGSKNWPRQRDFAAWAYFLGAFLLLACASWAQVALSVLQTNIHRDLGGSDSNVDSQSALAQEINYLNPDIWTINELGGNNVKFSLSTATADLNAFIQGNLTIFGTSPVLGRDYYVSVGTLTDGYIAQAIVSRYPIVSSQTFSDAGGGNNALRGLVQATVSVPNGGLLSVFTAHLKALGDDTSAQKRQAEAAADAATVSGWIASHPAQGVIMTGDFNETIESGADNWSNGNLNDTISLADGTSTTYNPVGTLKSAGLLDPRPTAGNGSRNTISSSSPTKRFDYILYAPQNLSYVNGLVFNSLYNSGLPSSTSAEASDHLAVYETFLLVPEPSGTFMCGGTILVCYFFRRSRYTRA